jgi:hypothetical protein
MLYNPGGKDFSSYFPSMSVKTPIDKEVIPTEAKGIGSLLIELYTLPLIIPF